MISWQENKSKRLIFKVISLILISAFLVYDISWACQGDIGPSIKLTNNISNTLRAEASSKSLKEGLEDSLNPESAYHKDVQSRVKLRVLLCKIFLIATLFISSFLPLNISAEPVIISQPPNSISIALDNPSYYIIDKNVTHIYKKEGSFYFAICGINAPPSVGMVYQPVPKGKHISDYKNKNALLYNALLDKKDGGLGHAYKLYNIGVKQIRIYQFDTEDVADIEQLKAIFNNIYEKYGIRVLLGNYVGLYDNINYKNPEELKKVLNKLQTYVSTFCHEPWMLGWIVGNENNLHLRLSQHKPTITLTAEEYYGIMDMFAGAVKASLEAERTRQIVLLGNGDLTPEETTYIASMKNIDGLGINCYRDREDLEELIEDAKRKLDMPIFFTEIGMAARTYKEKRQQAQYLEEILKTIYANTPGAEKKTDIIGAFVCEATDQLWKAEETGKEADGSYGIFGKNAENTIKNFSNELLKLRKYHIPKDSSEYFLSKAWEALLSYDYSSARKWADRCIAIYYNEALEQQRIYNSLPYPPRTKDEIVKFWALNDVATSYYILGRSYYEVNMKEPAKSAFDVVLENFPNAHVMDNFGKYWKLTDAIKKIFPDLYAPKIMLSKEKIAIFAAISAFLLSLLNPAKNFIASKFRRTIEGVGTSFDFAKRHIKKIDVVTLREKITHFGLVFISFYFLEYLASWWFHPVRMHYYIVNYTLFWLLSYIGAFTILIFIYVWHVINSVKRPEFIPAPSNKKVAMVTTYVPADSIELVKETLTKMINVRYTHDTFVLDEVNDPTLREICKKLGAIHFSRKGIDKYNQPSGTFKTKHKAGNLNSWIDAFGSNYEFVTFFDPDHQPKPEYLDRVLGYFQDEKVGFVQAPQIYRNQNESWIADGAAQQTYYYFGPLMMGYFGKDGAMVNGCHSTFRIEALLDIGGYAVHNADDVLASLRMLSKKWKGVYTPEILAEGLTPADWGSYLKQQLRWSHSVFDLLFYHYPKYIFKLKPRQFLPYLICGIYYLTVVNFFLLLLLPIISVAINQPPVNVELLTFLKIYLPFLLSEYFILIAWGQRYLIKPKAESGIWWKSGFLEIAASPYVTGAFIYALLKRQYPRPTTPKTSPVGVSYLKLFIPHIIILAGSLTALILAYIKEPIIWQTKGMKLFLFISIITNGSLILTSTKWFSNIYQRWKDRRKGKENIIKDRIVNFIQRIQFQNTGIMDTQTNFNPRFQCAFDYCA